MNSRAAQEILIACRPGSADLHTLEAKAALEQVERRAASVRRHHIVAVALEDNAQHFAQ